MLALATAIVGAILVARLPRWTDAFAVPSVRPIVATLAAALVGLPGFRNRAGVSQIAYETG